MHFTILFLFFHCLQASKYSEFEKKAISSLAEQTLKSVEKRFEECLKSAQNGQKRTKSASEVNLLVWDNFPEAKTMIEGMVTMDHIAPEETVIIANDVNEDPKSPKIKKLVKKIKKKKPKAKVVSVDWSKVVRI